MTGLSQTGIALVALFCSLCFCFGVWGMLRGIGRSNAASAERTSTLRLNALLASGPATPLLIHPGGRLEGSNRLAEMMGFDILPATLEVLGGSMGEAGDASALAKCCVEAASLGSSFSLFLRTCASTRVLLVRGGPAPPPYRPGTVLVWFADATESEEHRASLRGDADRLAAALKALTALIEAAPFPMWHRGPDLRLALVNSAYVRAVEADSALAVIKSGIELIDEGEGRSALSQAAAVLQKGEPVSRTMPATLAGERRTVQVVEVPLGEGVAGYAIDVEDREQARVELARFVRAQRDMLDRLSAGVAQFSRDRSLIFVNQPFARLFSLGADFLADQPEFDRVIDRMRESGNLPEVRDFPEWKNERRAWFTSGLSADEEDWLLPGGKHLRVVAQPLPDGGLLLILEDRTEQIQLASARDTLLRVRTATFDNLFEAVGVFASDGRIHLWNTRFSELWEFDEQQLAAHPRIDALVPHIATKLKESRDGAQVRELVRSATVERKQRNGQVCFTDGREFDFAVVPLPDGNALFTMLDVTDSRSIEAALRDRNEALQEADRMKTAFVSNVSYELRTPLTSIGGFAEMLAGGYAGSLPPTAIEYVGAINESVERLGSLIDDVLALAQSDVGTPVLADENVDLRALCGEVAEARAGQAAAKDIELALDLDPTVGEITGDPQRLRQALDNIVKNAVAYTGEGGRVQIRAEGGPRAAEITVSDNGRGIDPDEQARVFDRFHRTVGRQAGEGASLGLGLALTRQFVEAHGGTVKLQSEPGVGTTVCLFLPRTGT